MYSLIGALALLTAAITAALALRRTHQRSKAGHRTSRDTNTAPTTDSSPTADAPEGVLLLDAALRTMAHHDTQLPQPANLPTIRGALIAATSVRVLTEDPTTEPPIPFTASDDGHWELPEDADLLDADTAAQAPAPYLALVTLGTTDNNELLLLNLASLPALLLDGAPERIGEVCTALAVEIATNPWTDGLDLIAVGCGTGLDRLLPASQATHVPDAPHALREANERLLEAQQLPAVHRAPLVVLCAAPLDTDSASRFADLTTTNSPRPLTLIAPAHTTTAHFPHAPVLDASVHHTQYFEHLDAHITLQRLTPAAYHEITTALQNADTAQPRTHSIEHNTGQNGADHGANAPAQSEQAPTADLPAPAVPSAAASTAHDDGRRSDGGGVFPALLTALRSTSTDPALSHPRNSRTDARASAGQTPALGTDPGQPARRDASKKAHTRPGIDRDTPQIRVLGPVEVDGVDAGGHGPRIAQLAALLYFKPGRSADTLCHDMDPARPWSSTTLNSRLHGLRSALGKDPTGKPYVPRRKAGDDPYHLHPAITCDWTRFQHLTQPPPSDERTTVVHIERLEAALALVRGTPFDGKAMPWAEPLQQEMSTAVIDVAHAVATHRMSPGPHQDLDTARQAVARGIDIDETAEVLYRDWILIEEAAGNRHGVRTAISRIQHIRRTLNCPLEEETAQLINTLLGPARHT